MNMYFITQNHITGRLLGPFPLMGRKHHLNQFYEGLLIGALSIVHTLASKEVRLVMPTVSAVKEGEGEYKCC